MLRQTSSCDRAVQSSKIESNFLPGSVDRLMAKMVKVVGGQCTHSINGDKKKG